MSDQGISVSVAFDKDLIWERGRSVRYIEIDIVAPCARDSNKTTEKAPLNLALVIDASGSMSGEPIECAKTAAVGVVNALSPTSRLSIVSFASRIITHIDGASIGERKKALAAIRELTPRDSTNLGAGWIRGSECVARIMEEYSRMHNHVVLLSDGHANAGITDPMVLAHHAEQLRSRGIVTSTVGIGDGYSSAQLQALADHGGGQLHDAQYPHEIIEVVLGELQEVQETIVEDIAVTLSFQSGLRVENLSGFPTVMSSSSALTQLGMLAPERKRPVIFRVTAPDGHAGDQLSFEASCSWIKTGTSERVQGKRASADLTFVSESRNSLQKRDNELSLRVAQCWQSGVVRKCVAFNRQGDLKELGRYLDNELKYFSRYCQSLPDADRLVAELQRMKEQANRRWDERSLKTMDHSSYMTQQSQNDYRSINRGNWSDSLGS
jgi:Ca-activated chloride channel family protein